MASPQTWNWIGGGQAGNAGALTLIVTNDAALRAYRVAVRLP